MTFFNSFTYLHNIYIHLHIYGEFKPDNYIYISIIHRMISN